MMSYWLAAFGAPYGGGKRGGRGLAVVRGVGRYVAGGWVGAGHEDLDAVQEPDQPIGPKAPDDRNFPIDPA